MTVRGSNYFSDHLAELFPRGDGREGELERLISQINPTSMDLTLSPKVIVYPPVTAPNDGWGDYMHGTPAATHIPRRRAEWLADLSLYEHPDPDKTGLWFYPGASLLVSTEQYVRIPDDKTGLLLMKTTPGRELINHFWTGWLDPGYEGTLTTAIAPVARPVRLWRGRKMFQLVLFDTQDVGFTYGDGTKKANYQGSVGPTGSWETK